MSESNAQDPIARFYELTPIRARTATPDQNLAWGVRAAPCACGAQIGPRGAPSSEHAPSERRICQCEAWGASVALEFAFANLLTFALL